MVKLFTYDFEVYEFDWTVTFKNLQTSELIYIENDLHKLKTFTNDNANSVFIGFNNFMYDKYIWDILLEDKNPIYFNNQLINEKKKPWNIHRLKNKLIQYDVYRDLPDRASLKVIEGNLGLMIKESNISFDINRQLTSSELLENKLYNEHDVNATSIIFNNRLSTFKSKLLLLTTFKFHLSNIEKTIAQIAALILNAKKSDVWKTEIEYNGKTYIDKDFYIPPDNLQISKYKNIVEKFGNDIPDNFESFSENICGVEHIFGLGGLHGAEKNKYYEGDIIIADFLSYYPSLMILYNYMSRGVSQDGLDTFLKIYFDRLDYKANGITDLADAFKLVVNIVYGCLGSQYNNLFDPRMRKAVCISGQLFLVDLLEKLEPLLIQNGKSYFIQSNTDGIMFERPPHISREEFLNIIKDFENRTGLKMDITFGKRMWQKDVNNYIFEKENGELKYKGAITKDGDLLFNSNIIINEAVKQYIVYGIKPDEYIRQTHPLIKFQIIAKGGHQYSGFYHFSYGRYFEIQKVNRVFASNDKNNGTLYKKKDDNLTYEKIASLPENCIIYNDDITKLNNYDMNIDFQYYIDSAWKKIAEFVK